MADNRKIFIDANILIYASLAKSPFHEPANQSLRKMEEQEGIELHVSRQVLREYLAVMTRPGTFTKDLQRQSITDDIRHFEEDFIVLEGGSDVTFKLLDLAERYPVAGKQIHDANIVATMIAHGTSELLTHNVSDFKRFSPEIKIIPLVNED